MSPEPLTLAINSQQDVISARQLGRELAERLGFSLVDQSRITTAVSELARNIVVYGGCGTVTMRLLSAPDGRAGLEFRFDDDGPGIADLDRAMEQGYTSGNGLGAGLPGSRRLMDEFEISSVPDGGVHIVTRKWK